MAGDMKRIFQGRKYKIDTYVALDNYPIFRRWIKTLGSGTRGGGRRATRRNTRRNIRRRKRSDINRAVILLRKVLQILSA